MKRTTRRATLAVLLLFPLAAAGCGKDSAKADKATFCKTNAEVDAATANINSEDQAVTAFTNELPTMDRAVDQAPADIKADVKTMVDAIHHAVDSKDFSALQSTDLDAVNQRIEQFCS